MSLYGPVRAEGDVGTGEAAVTLSLDWKEVAATKHTLRVVDPVGGQSLPLSARYVRSLPHPDRKASIPAVRFTPAGTLLTAGYPSGVIQIWDPVSGKELRRIESPRGYRGSADYALMTADQKTLYVPIDGRKVTRTPDDPKRAFRIDYQGEVLVWDLTTGRARASLKPAAGRGVVMAYLSPDGARLITVERAGYWAGDEPPADVVRMVETGTGRGRTLCEGFAMAAFSADGRRAYVAVSRRSTGKMAGSLKVFDAEGKELATLLAVAGQRVSQPTPAPDGKRIAVEVSKGRINEPGTLKVFDLVTNKEVAAFASGGNYPFLTPTFSPDGRLLAAGDYGGNLTLWDVARQTVVHKHTFKGMGLGYFGVAFSPDGTRLAVPARVKTDDDRARDPDPLDVPQPRVYLFDLTKGGEPEELVCPHGWAAGVAFSPDGKVLAAGGAGAVHLFDVSRR